MSTQDSLFLGQEKFDKKDFLLDSQNQETFDRLLGEWSETYMCLCAPNFSGKTRFARYYAEEKEGIFITGFDFAMGSNLHYIFEDADLFFEKNTQDSFHLGDQVSQAEKDFFHFYEKVKSHGSTLLLTCHKTPSKWALNSSDLKSRFSQLPVVTFREPTPDFAVQLLAKYFAEEGINLSPKILIPLSEKLPHTYEALYHYTKKVAAANLSDFSLNTLLSLI